MSKFRRFLPIIIILVAGTLFLVFDLGRFFSLDALRTYKADLLEFVDANRVLAIVGMMLIYTLAVALSAPVALYLSLLCGFIFGPWIGIPVVVVSATAGACILFVAARGALANFFRERTGAWFHSLSRGFEKNAFSYMLFLRLVPAFPFFIVNVVPAFFGVSLSTYALATFLGILPGTAVCVLIGQSLGIVIDQGGNIGTLLSEYPEVPISLLGLGVLALIPILVKRFRRKT